MDYLWLVTSGRLNHEGDDQQRKSDAIECLDDLVRTLFLDSEEVVVGWKGLLVDTQRRDRETGKLKSPSNRTAVSIGRSIQSSMDIVKRKLDKPTRKTKRKGRTRRWRSKWKKAWKDEELSVGVRMKEKIRGS